MHANNESVDSSSSAGFDRWVSEYGPGGARRSENLFGIGSLHQRNQPRPSERFRQNKNLFGPSEDAEESLFV